MTLDQISDFVARQKQKILSTGTIWSRFILLPDHDPLRHELQHMIISDANIGMLVHKLQDPSLGIPSMLATPADYRMYGSFYWVLRFLADIGITAEHLGIQHLMQILLWQQMEDGQFMIRYHRQKQQAISYICLTAHLGYCLVRLGFRHSNAVAAAVNYIVTSQRWDGGWHCDRLKQPGEKLANAPSCPAATVHIARLLSQFDGHYEAMIAPAVRALMDLYPQSALFRCELDPQLELNLSKLRYPPHYTGLDVLNVLHSIAPFARTIARPQIDRLVEQTMNRWDGKGLLRSEKRIPEWAAFDFGRKQGGSDWITGLFIQALESIYFDHRAVA